MFAIKCLFKQRPYSVLVCSTLISLFVFGFQLKIFEGPMSGVSGQNYTNLANCVWNVIITLATVGYGDFFPKTFFGRIVGIIISFYGLAFSSTLVVTVTNQLSFNSQQNKAFDLLHRITLRDELKNNAAKCF